MTEEQWHAAYKAHLNLPDDVSIIRSIHGIKAHTVYKTQEVVSDKHSYLNPIHTILPIDDEAGRGKVYLEVAKRHDNGVSAGLMLDPLLDDVDLVAYFLRRDRQIHFFPRLHLVKTVAKNEYDWSALYGQVTRGDGFGVEVPVDKVWTAIQWDSILRFRI